MRVTSFIAMLLLMSVARAGDVNIVGTYSDMGYNDESGDVTGEEVQVLVSLDGYYVVYQCRDSAPHFAPAKMKGDEISFSIDSNSGDCWDDARGLITKAGMCLWTPGMETDGVFLPRIESYWLKRKRPSPKIQACAAPKQ